jgi:hypothetical protein
MMGSFPDEPTARTATQKNQEKISTPRSGTIPMRTVARNDPNSGLNER